jgi:hypothetical protein
MVRHYEILGVTPGVSLERVKKAYREQVKRFHPDTNHAADAHERFVEVQEAFGKILKDYENTAERLSRQPDPSSKYQPGSFGSFYYRQYRRQQAQKERKEFKIPTFIYWLFHGILFFTGIAILINSVNSLARFTVPQYAHPIEYLLMLLFTLLLGLVLTGICLFSAYFTVRSYHRHQ